MVDQIDELKRKYTDKYVVVDGQRPELARFRDTYGRVKTVNMSGRALVEFADYHTNIGWYDIDPAFLKLIDQPPPPRVKEAPAREPAAKKPPAGEPASAGGKPAAKPKPAATKPAAAPAAKADRSKMSVADMLAAARSGGGAAKAKPPAEPELAAEEPAGEVASATGPSATPAPEPAAAPPKKSSGATVDKKSMTVDQMIAWSREHDTK